MSKQLGRNDAVWVVVALLAALSTAIWAFQLREYDQLVESFSLSLLTLVVVFIAAEAFVVHLHFRSEAGTFSFLEFPIFFGAFFASASDVWIAATIGIAVALVAVRRQALIKVAFNMANLSLQAATGLWSVHLLVDASDPLAPSAWLAVGFAALLSGAVGIAAFVVVVAITEGGIDVPRVSQTVAFGSLTSLANVSLALIAASLIDYRPSSVLLTFAPLGVLFVAYRAYTTERAQYERLQFLHESTSEIRSMGDETSIPDVLGSIAARMRGERADLLLLQPESGQHATHFSAIDGVGSVRQLDEPSSQILVELVRELGKPELLRDSTGEQFARLVGTDVHSGISGQVRGDDGPIGLLLVTNRLGDVTGFTTDDVKLFSTVLEQFELALENDLLEQTVTELKRVERELSHDAMHDPLTELGNRSMFLSVLSDALAADAPAAVLFVDLDDFKLVNDRLGHEAGDYVLRETANRIRATVRPTDCVARLGGDEFAILLFESSEAVTVAHRLVQAIHEPVLVPPHDARVGASIGIAHTTPGQTPARVLANADAAMYTAKRNGKGSVEVYEPEFTTRIERDQHVHDEFQKAVETDNLDIAYQPICNLATGDIIGFEALARLRVDDEEVLPDRFIESAEQSGLAAILDSRIITRVAADAGLLFAEADAMDSFVELNLSASNLMRHDVVQTIAEALLVTEVEPGRLVVDIGEKTLAGADPHVVGQLFALRELGVRIAIDDYGSGLSSPSDFRKLPVDFVKIARSATADLPHDPTFVKAIIEHAQTFGVTVLANGVETSSQVDCLRALGCEIGQGFLFGKPQRLEALPKVTHRTPTTVIGSSPKL